MYDEPSPDDGRRVLVDRLWPRGVRKDDPRIEEWMPDVAPSASLRRGMGTNPHDSTTSARRYEHEHTTDGTAMGALEGLRDCVGPGPVKLLIATRDLDTSHLAVLVVC